MNEEFKQRVAGLREGCFPRPSGVGCRCVVKNSEGQDLENIYHNDADCKVGRKKFKNPKEIIGSSHGLPATANWPNRAKQTFIK